jgi:hypothetical protein
MATWPIKQQVHKNHFIEVEHRGLINAILITRRKQHAEEIERYIDQVLYLCRIACLSLAIVGPCI